jgi:hypothetical protein
MDFSGELRHRETQSIFAGLASGKDEDRRWAKHLRISEV